MEAFSEALMKLQKMPEFNIILFSVIFCINGFLESNRGNKRMCSKQIMAFSSDKSRFNDTYEFNKRLLSLSKRRILPNILRRSQINFNLTSNKYSGI